ncbi:MAG: 30S ribosomal protein S1 [Clostridia bacterium]|nr:30S ribosomal protein S1 [Clostridia bacterium]
MTDNTYLPEGSRVGTAQNREYVSSAYGLEKARLEGKILEGMVIKCDSGDFSLHLDLYGIPGIIPREEVAYLPGGEVVKDIAIITRVGKPVCFKVLELIRDEGGVRAVLSRRAAQIDCMQNYLMSMIPGDVVPARVTHLEPFGAFVDIGCGIVSLLSVDCISVSRISHPKDRFAVRQEILAVVKSIDYETGRIYVSHRELLGTWEENAARFTVGQTVAGIVRSVEPYGIFIELAPNLAGLAERKEGVRVGESCAVYIKSIIPDKMKIKLVLIDSYAADTEPARIRYDSAAAKEKHIDLWRYSPAGCDKVVESVFVSSAS